MKLHKRLIALFTVLFLCAGSIFNYNIANAAEKLSKKDFIFTGNDFEGEEYNFIEDIDSKGYAGENGWGMSYHVYNKEVDKSKKGCVKTKRGVVLGSTMKTVKKEYGDKAEKVVKKDNLYKCLDDQSNKALSKTLKASETYLDYNYTWVDSMFDYKNKATIRYYFDKDDKVSVIVLCNNIKFIPY